MNNPKCPYCGGEMEYYWDNNPMKPEGWFFCPKCHSKAPTAKTEGEAFAAAMKRDRAKGMWEGEYFRFLGWTIKCSKCGKAPDYFIQGDEWSISEKPHYCPNCGAETRVGRI